MATHSSMIAWKVPWTEEPVGYCPWGSQRVRHNLVTKQQQNLKHQQRHPPPKNKPKINSALSSLPGPSFQSASVSGDCAA